MTTIFSTIYYLFHTDKKLPIEKDKMMKISMPSIFFLDTQYHKNLPDNFPDDENEYYWVLSSIDHEMCRPQYFQNQHRKKEESF